MRELLIEKACEAGEKADCPYPFQVFTESKDYHN